MSRPLIQVLDLAKSYGSHQVFTNISFLIREGEVIALVGPNGVGKSTLLRILAGLEPSTSGAIIRFQDIQIGCVPQDPAFEERNTPWDVLHDASAAKAQEALSRFGLAGDAHLPVGSLSGGQKTRLALAKIWMSPVHLLLLDEPTNHLDLAGIDWLESFIKGYPGTVLVVSHHRTFLDKTASRVIVLSPNQAIEYEGTYTSWREAKEADYQRQLDSYEQEQKRIRKVEADIDRHLRWFEGSHRQAGTNDFYRARAKGIARRAKAQIKRLARMKESAIARPKGEMTVRLPSLEEQAIGRRVILAKGLTYSFAKELFKPSDFAVFRGEKVGIVGPNGCGKTTLLRLIKGDLEAQGHLWVTPGARIACLDQELEALDYQAPVLDEVMKVVRQPSAESITLVRTLLKHLRLAADDAAKPIGALSIGQRRCIALVKLVLSDFNLLLLDEPMNHLDIALREKLVEVLQAYHGTVLLASHDQHLLAKLCTKILSFEEHIIVSYAGYAEYEAGGQLAGGADERLLLEARMARLTSELCTMNKDDPGYEEKEQEFFAAARKLRSLKE
ncbi:MAG: ABC-F family ATP-binding cassette domain-containing protein [Firmicutes bacterium]|nr:ABC-F family ATP-binding cassette domain-containing protein [Bacillota bacterium]